VSLLEQPGEPTSGLPQSALDVRSEGLEDCGDGPPGADPQDEVTPPVVDEPAIAASLGPQVPPPAVPDVVAPAHGPEDARTVPTQAPRGRARRRGRHAAQRHPRTSGSPVVRFEGVCELTPGPDGPITVPELNLCFDDEGIEITNCAGERIWVASWNDVTEITTPIRSKTPDLRRGVVVLVGIRDVDEHRLTIPASRPQSVEKTLGKIARARAVAPDRPERPALKVVSVVVVALSAAGVTLLLLTAGHILHLHLH
jgi:hypothetical protein